MVFNIWHSVISTRRLLKHLLPSQRVRQRPWAGGHGEGPARARCLPRPRVPRRPRLTAPAFPRRETGTACIKAVAPGKSWVARFFGGGFFFFFHDVAADQRHLRVQGWHASIYLGFAFFFFFSPNGTPPPPLPSKVAGRQRPARRILGCSPPAVAPSRGAGGGVPASLPRSPRLPAAVPCPRHHPTSESRCWTIRTPVVFPTRNPHKSQSLHCRATKPDGSAYEFKFGEGKRALTQHAPCSQE